MTAATDQTAAQPSNAPIEASEHQHEIESSDTAPNSVAQPPITAAITPAQDSPQHILNVLNNDCMKEVIRRQKSIRDFLNTAQVCTCFQANAIQCFPSHFKAIRFDDSELAEHMTNNLPLSCAENFLKIFGDLINSIEWGFTLNRDNDAATLNMIAQFSGKTLSSFTIHGHDLDFNTQSPFEALENLALYDLTISNFALLPQLKCLKMAFIRVKHSDWLAQEFPKLEEAKFYSFHKLRDKMFIEFLRLNPQLQSLDWNCCPRISSSVFQDIGTRSPNLVRLNIDPCKGLQSTFDTNMVHLSRLRKLKSLRIECHKFSGRALIDSLADVPIEHLTVVGAVRDLADSIPKLKKLKTLWLSFIFEEMLVNVVKALPELEKLTVGGSYDVTLGGVIEVLEHGKSLSSVSICLDEVTFDLEDFNSILALAKGRVHVDLRFYEGVVSVEEEVLQANREWLNIEKC